MSGIRGQRLSTGEQAATGAPVHAPPMIAVEGPKRELPSSRDSEKAGSHSRAARSGTGLLPFPSAGSHSATEGFAHCSPAPKRARAPDARKRSNRVPRATSRSR